MSKIEFAVFGAGGAGGYFGALLARAGYSVAFIARGAHLEAIRRSGLRISSSQGDFEVTPAQITDNPADVGSVDAVIFDVDVVDFNDLPLAENYSKNKGLSYHHTLELLEVLLNSPKFAGLTLTEINPDHGAEDGSTIQTFAQDLSHLLALLPSWP